MDDLTPAERIDPDEHISADDERYDGFRIREYWIATAVAPDNQEAPLYVDSVMARDFHLSVGPAMASDERRLNHLRELAVWVVREYKVAITIRHYVPEGEPEVMEP